MEDYQLRVIVEKEDLDAKIHKLSGFISSSKFNEINDPHEKDRLEEQLRIMNEYSNVLYRRIKNFIE